MGNGLANGTGGIRPRNGWRALAVLGLALLPVLVVAPPAVAAPTCPEFVAPEDGEPKKVVSGSLDGAQVVSSGTTGKGDPDGSGTVLLGLEDVTKNIAEVSFMISTNQISLPLSGAHIHAGEPGTTGVAGFTLFDHSDQSDVSGVISMSKCSAHDIFQRPEGFYVDVHNFDYPDQGAIRGQLGDAR